MSEFTRVDFLRIKWSLLAVVGSLALIGGLFAGIRTLDQGAARDLQRARTDFNNAEEKVELIELEKTSILSNLQHYQDINQAGLLLGEDRLLMREHFAQLRNQQALFPINYELSKQSSLPLKYGELDGDSVDDPGRPIAVQTSELEFSLALLHENDFFNLLNYLMEQPELLQIQRCSLAASGRRPDGYARLGQHFNASCLLLWYTFHIDETLAEDDSE
jgi:hypothetical protein